MFKGDRRLFATVLRISDDGSALVRRLDDRGDVRVPRNEVAKAGTALALGDVIEMRVWPPGNVGGDILLVRRARVLAATAS